MMYFSISRMSTSSTLLDNTPHWRSLPILRTHTILCYWYWYIAAWMMISHRWMPTCVYHFQWIWWWLKTTSRTWKLTYQYTLASLGNLLDNANMIWLCLVHTVHDDEWWVEQIRWEVGRFLSQCTYIIWLLISVDWWSSRSFALKMIEKEHWLLTTAKITNLVAESTSTPGKLPRLSPENYSCKQKPFVNSHTSRLALTKLNATHCINWVVSHSSITVSIDTCNHLLLLWVLHAIKHCKSTFILWRKAAAITIIVVAAAGKAAVAVKPLGNCKRDKRNDTDIATTTTHPSMVVQPEICLPVATHTAIIVATLCGSDSAKEYSS